jgi:hypothetical protein
MAVDEPDALDTIMPNEDDNESDDSSLEILDSGSDTDICEESELAKFSKMLSDAQKKALAKEKAQGKKRKRYTGHSRTTAYRRKVCRNKLAAQGFLSVTRFWAMSQKSAEELTPPTFEESEESSDELTLASEDSDCCQVAQGPAVSEDRSCVAVTSEQRRRAAQEEEEDSTGSEGDDEGTTDENRCGVASRNGTHLGAALFWRQI